LLFQPDDERPAWSTAARVFEYLVKWKPRRPDLAASVVRAQAANAFQAARRCKFVALLDLRAERAWQQERLNFRLIARVTERTRDRHGQHLVLPDVRPEGWWTSLDEAPRRFVDRYAKHGTHEQFHSEFKTNIFFEPLPSGKFDCNDLILTSGRSFTTACV